MSTTRKAIYSFDLDGGAVGTIVLRGALARQLEAYISVCVVVLEAVACGPSTTLDFGWAGFPTGLLSGVDPNYFTTVPAIQAGPLPPPFPGVHFGSAEPFTMTINGDPLADGELAVLIECASP